MRTVGIPVHNNQTLDVFTRRRGGLYDGFEVWMVGIVKSERVILDHFITQEHMERRLAYARPGDLAWVDTELSALPSQKTRAAQEAEETIKRGKFLDLASLIYYFNAVYWLSPDRKMCNAAKRAILGRWTDGVATITFEPESRLQISCPAAASHPLYSAAYDHQADWWSFAPWMLHMLNDKKKSGERTSVFRCDERELHILSRKRDTLVHVFHRDSAA